MKQPLIAILALSALRALAGQEGAPAKALSFPQSIGWQPRFRGVEYAELTLKQPRVMRGHMLRVDLQEPGVELVVTPGNGERPGETDGMKTSTFLRRMKCQAAVNAAPFSPVRSQEGRPQDVSGLLVHDGEVVSGAGRGLPALLIREKNRVSVEKPPFDLDGVRNAVAGFSIVSSDNRVTARGDSIHPRTAAGIGADRRFLYLLVIDGRQPGYSEGATTREVAQWLQRLGASDAINLDGGGTSTMVLESGDGGAKVANRPIHRLIPGTERVSGSHLGVRAQPLKVRR